MGNNGARLEIGAELQKVAASLRQSYIDYVGALSLANNSFSWWLGSFPEKNPLVSRTFLYACYLKLCRTILEKDGRDALVFVGENNTIRTALALNLANIPGHEIVRFEASLLEFFSAIKNNLKLAAIKAYFYGATLYHVLIARRYRGKFKAGENSTLLYNWVDPRSFTPAGEYRDNYFGELAGRLRDEGKKVVIVPRILPAVPYGETLIRLQRSLDSFILPESFLTVPDIFSVCFKTIFSFSRKKSFPTFEGMEINGLIRRDLNRDRQATALAANLLLYEVVARWKKSGLIIENVIYPYENQAWEKAFIIALRKFYPSARLIGYQHSTVPKMLLNHFFTKAEAAVMPFPDKVITAGRQTEKLFKESGYDPAKVVRGGAIRYTALLKKKTTAPANDIKHQVILVTPSIDRNETLELTWKTLKAFGDKPQYQVIFKFHPDCPYAFITDKLENLPEHFIVSDKPVGDLLAGSSILLYNSSSSALEALALGVPILHVASDFSVDRDNLGDFSGNIRLSASTPDDIVQAVQQLRKISPTELAHQQECWMKVVAEMFGPVTKRTYDLFL